MRAATSHRQGRRNAGVVLLIVLFFALLLTGSIASFVKRATVDAMISNNRDAAASAAAIARGGVRLAQALLMQDALIEEASGLPGTDSTQDSWAQLRELAIPLGEGTLRVEIEDTGVRLNLNALFESDGAGGRQAVDSTEPFLMAFLEKVIGEMPLPPGETALYDPRDLAENLIDYVDADEERVGGGPEDGYYQSQDPPYRAWNKPLLSVEQLGEIEGFDEVLLAELRPYVTVYPFAPGGCAKPGVGCGVNLNTAPPHVLALLYYDDGVDLRLASEDVVRQVLQIRQDEGWICGAASDEQCTPISEIVANPIFPPPTFSTNLFVVRSEGEVAGVRRSVEALVDRSKKQDPRLLSWRVR